MTAITCDCGGTLRPSLLHDFELTVYVGLPVRAKEIQGLRCDKCGWETIRGPAIGAATRQVAVLVLGLPERLSPAQAKFLRGLMGHTQKELAERMGITRKTVAEWEGKKGHISPQNDLILRILAYAKLLASESPSVVAPELLQALTHIRTAAPKARRPPLEIGRINEAA